jgi:Amt family ammonium transporter
MCIAFFTILDRTIGMRSDTEAEISGLDLPELGALAYPDFLEAQGTVFVPVEPGDGNGSLEPVTAAGLREELGR